MTMSPLSTDLEYNPIDDRVHQAGVIEENHAHHHELCVQNQHPREESTEHTTNVFDTPESSIKAPKCRN